MAAEDKIRAELADGTLAPLPMREGGERSVQLCIVYADRDAAGPGTLRLGEIIRDIVASECGAFRARREAAAKKGA